MVKNSYEESIINYLKKNTNFFIKYPNLLNELKIPNSIELSNKIIDLNAYRSKKFKEKYDLVKKKLTEIIKIDNLNIISRNRILKSTLKIIKIQSTNKLLDLIIDDFKYLLDCDFVSLFSNNNNLKNNKIICLSDKISSKFFKGNLQTNLDQSPKGLITFFEKNYKFINSYILIKIKLNNSYLIIAMGSKKENKFEKSHKVDLINYLIKVLEIKFSDLEKK
ncbi:MAG: hypothetical protein CFH19_00027 [Alphaproteobacteria bacterium MarineAlpha5_Bin9]|nr:MAG: hypothetical protein CFH19_00027 [Alphaproteobacteria bacterium MarineAlpha5_Bin9]|tara:strand:- start:14493 stop:15155 length:663 start_codon:yes stop_codon:yes gene_type:complete